MTISKDLYSILSLDAYNRGYNSGVVDFNGDSQAGLGEDGSIGNAVIKTRLELNISEAKYVEWQAAGFYAVAYEVDSEIVISYRGTDTGGELVGTMPAASCNRSRLTAVAGMTYGEREPTPHSVILGLDPRIHTQTIIGKAQLYQRFV